MLIIQGHRDSFGENTYLGQSIRENNCRDPEQEVMREQEADGIHLHPDWWVEEILFTDINRSFFRELSFFHSQLLNVLHSFFQSLIQ